VGLLGEGFDVHGGGVDLVFPHHENERAQSEGAGQRFARYWVHNAMVNVGGEKMARSLGNFTTLEEAVDSHGPRALRLLVLQTHYRSNMEVAPDNVAVAARALATLDALARRARTAGVERLDTGRAALDPATVAAFDAALDDDFNMPAAMAAIFEATRKGNLAIDAGGGTEAGRLVSTVHALTGALGLELDDGSTAGEGDDEINSVVEARNAARKAKDFAEADRIRAELAARGVTLEDGPSGTTWHRG
jgi:cysteinyl-tRNA synthetase